VAPLLVTLDRLVADLTIGGETLDEKELDGLVLAGQMAEQIDREDACSSD
jgi:hypothetical protein